MKPKLSPNLHHLHRPHSYKRARAQHRNRRGSHMTHHRCTLRLRTAEMMFRRTVVRTKGSTGHHSHRPSKLRKGWRRHKLNRPLTRLQLTVPGKVEVRMERGRGDCVRMVGRRVATRRRKMTRRMTKMWTRMVTLLLQGEARALGKASAGSQLKALRTAPQPI